MLCCFLKAKQNDLGNILLGDLFWEVTLCYVHEYFRNFRCSCSPVTGSYFIPSWWCSMFTSLTTCSIKIVLVSLCPEYEWNFVHWGSWAWNMGKFRAEFWFSDWVFFRPWTKQPNFGQLKNWGQISDEIAKTKFEFWMKFNQNLAEIRPKFERNFAINGGKV